MSYRRIETQDGKTVMNKELYDNLQDGIEEALEKGSLTLWYFLKKTIIV